MLFYKKQTKSPLQRYTLKMARMDLNNPASTGLSTTIILTKLSFKLLVFIIINFNQKSKESQDKSCPVHGNFRDWSMGW